MATPNPCGETLFSPDFHIDIGLGFQLKAHIEQRAAQSIKYIRIVSHAQEGHLHNAINGCDPAQLSAPLQHPLLDRACKSPSNHVNIRHNRLPYIDPMFLYMGDPATLAKA
jgi:hypothetical protein